MGLGSRAVEYPAKGRATGIRFFVRVDDETNGEGFGGGSWSEAGRRRRGRTCRGCRAGARRDAGFDLRGIRKASEARGGLGCALCYCGGGTHVTGGNRVEERATQNGVPAVRG